MGVYETNGNQGQGVVPNIQNAGTSFNQVQFQPGTVIDFFNNGLFSGSVSDAELQGYVEKMNKALEKSPVHSGYKAIMIPKDSYGISPFTKEEYKGLGYSSIVVYKTEDDNNARTAYCYLFLIGKTGRHSLTAEETINEVNAAMANNQGGRYIDTYVYADTINSELYSAIDVKLTEIDNKITQRVVIAANIIVPEVVDDEDVFLGKILHEAIVNIQLHEQERKSISPSIAQFTDKNNGELELRVKYINTGTITNTIGEPVKADAEIELWFIPKKLNNRSNSREMRFTENKPVLVLTNSVVITGVPVPVTVNVPNQFGQPVAQQRWQISPHVIRTSFRSPYPSLATNILGLAMVAQFASNKTKLLEIMARKSDTMNNQRPVTDNLTAFNIIGRTVPTDKEGKEFGMIKFQAKDTLEARALVLDKIFTGAPYISDDIVTFGENSLSTLTILKSKTSQTDITRMATAYGRLIGRGVSFTDVYFNKTLIPGGVYPKNNNYYDLRDILDLGYVMDKYNGELNKQAVVDALGVISPQTHGASENYDAAIRLLASEAPKAKINHKIERINYSAKFLSDITTALRESGLTVYTDLSFKLPTDPLAFGNFSVYANQGLNSLGSFVSQMRNNNNPFISANQYGSSHWFN